MPYRPLLVAALVALPTLAAAAPADDGPATASGRHHACGTRQVRRSVASPLARAGGPRTVYLNRFGGTYHITTGATNSATQTANVDVTNDGRTRDAVIAPMAADFDWAFISGCVQDHYAQYDLVFVESRPTSGVYLEAVVGGTGQELGFARDELFGIAGADNFCGVTEAGIAFSFSETHRGVGRDNEELCATIAHEVGHLLALEHETLATDLMSYVFITQSSTKAFVDMTSPCGVEPGQNDRCECTPNPPSTTNSAMRLRDFVGLRPTETVPPTLAVVSPDNGAELSPAFTVLADATDDVQMAEVTALVDGTAVASDSTPDGARYQIAVHDVAEGAHTLTVRARDRSGNTTSVDVAISVAKLGQGASCTLGSECAGGLCVAEGGEQYCTQTCTPGADTCPDGWSCESTPSGIAVCAGGAGGGCCQTGERPGAGSGLVALGVAGLLLRRRRRAR